jgi:transcriptional activator
VLLLHANETLSTDRLIEELWGEHPPATAAKTVQVHVSRLRKALAARAGSGSEDVVVTREHGYELALDPERLDAHRFERLVGRGRTDLAAGHPQRAASALEEALLLWRGRPLDDLAYEPFAQREIARLDDLQVGALEELIEAKLALGRHREVMGQLEGLIADPSVPRAPQGPADAGPLPLCGRVATATGTSERLIRQDRAPEPERWVVNTELENGSDQFAVGEPAMAAAIAVVKHENGRTEIERWSQTVSIVSDG